MEQIFLFVLNNAITVSALIIAIIMVRALGKKMPKWITCMLWIIVAFRLIVPIQIESALSLIPTREPIPANIAMENNPQISSGISSVDNYLNPVIGQSFAPNPEASVNPLQICINFAGFVWLAGVIMMFSYFLKTYMLLKKKVSASVKISNKVYECDDISDSFILGSISPKVYIPSGLSEKAKAYILKHEFAHLSRYDHMWKPLGFAILSVYWFNPLCWIAYILLCKDIEYACDEKVTKNIEKGEKAEYCRILLENSMPRKMIAACPVAFGETDVKNRIKNIANYKKPAFWITIASIIVCAVVGVCFATNKGSEPVKEQETKGLQQIAMFDAPNETVLSVRKGPGADYEAIGYIMQDDPYEIIEEVDGWYKIKLDNGDGYINSDYVKMIWTNAEISGEQASGTGKWFSIAAAGDCVLLEKKLPGPENFGKIVYDSPEAALKACESDGEDWGMIATDENYVVLARREQATDTGLFSKIDSKWDEKLRETNNSILKDYLAKDIKDYHEMLIKMRGEYLQN